MAGTVGFEEVGLDVKHKHPVMNNHGGYSKLTLLGKTAQELFLARVNICESENRGESVL